MFTGLTALSVSFVMTVALTAAFLPRIWRYRFGDGAEKRAFARSERPEYPPELGGALFFPAICLGVLGACLTAALAGRSLIDGGSFLPENARVRWWSCVLFVLGCALVGFACDRVTIRMGRGFRLPVTYRLLLEAVILTGLAISLSRAEATFISLPFLGNRDPGVLFFFILIPAGWIAVNAPRLTDGVSGLHAACAAVSALGTAVCAFLRGGEAAAAVSTAVLGAMLAFLPFHAARKLCPGEGGKYAAGACLFICGVLTDMLWLPLLTGLGFFAEWLWDVVCAVLNRARRGKREPIAHPLHQFLKNRGMPDLGVTAVTVGMNLAGSALAVVLILTGFER